MHLTESNTDIEARLGVRLAHALRNAPAIVCFGNDWDGDPTSKHHVMRLLAEHVPVLWVETSGMRRPNLSSPLDVRRVVQRLRRARTGVRMVGPRMAIVSPLSVPAARSRAARMIGRALYRRAIARGLAALGVRENPLLWVYVPTAATVVGSIPHAGLVYHCVDRWWAFGEYQTDLMRDHHAVLCRKADIVFASALELLEDCRQHTPRSHLVPHGVDWRHFASAAREDLPRPDDIADIEGPIAGFFGLVHEWVDLALLRRLALELPDVTLVIIGKVQVDVSMLAGLSNVRFVGQKPYSTLPAYAAAFDVALIPFVTNELTLAVNPIKLREYLAAGLPVVSVSLPEIEALSDNPMVRTAKTGDDFVHAVRATIEQPFDLEPRRVASDRIAEQTWLGRCVGMAEATRGVLGWANREAP